MTLPTRDELEEISAALKEAAASTNQTLAPNALGFACKGFAAGEFTTETVHSWLAIEATNKKSGVFAVPHGIPDPTDPDSINTNNRDKGRTPNPFSRDAWNVTEQGRLVKSNPKMAAALAASAGVKIGATKPKAA